MQHRAHSYRNGHGGRHLSSRPGIGGQTYTAHLQCVRCPHEGSLNLRVCLPPDQIDRKFLQAGWSLAPPVCPGCRSAANKEKAMSVKPSPAAMRAQLQMMTLLQTHFAVEAGTYGGGYSDARIAKETGMAETLVAEFRRECFGEIKEPAAIMALAADIEALDKMRAENDATMRTELAGLRKQLADVRKQWAA